MNLFELTGRAAYSLQPTEPFGVPRVLSLTFWGGMWGALFSGLLWRLKGERLVEAATLLGAALPTLVAWFVVAPLKGQLSDGIPLTAVDRKSVVEGKGGELGG